MIKKTVALLIFVVGVCAFAKAQDNMIVKINDSPVETIALDNVRKLTFAGGKLNVVKKNDVSPFSTASLSQTSVYFAAGTNGIADVSVAAGNCLIYPNPVKDVLNIQSTTPIGKVEILDLQGRLLLVFETSDTTVSKDVSSLAGGFYLLRVGGMTQKIIKK
ncbi:MAG: T9SS type A sorting domain-containing protein [Candidatus Azobacteroides sp.]|nr:T9SS type A sorting domain-containing protein [Candidatus Azobacteroides sp.]